MDKKQLIRNKKSSRLGKKIVSIILIMSMLMTSSLMFASSKGLTSNSEKVLTAVINTLKDQSHLTKDLDCSRFFKGDTYQIQLEGGTKEGYGSLSYSTSNVLKQLKGELEIPEYPRRVKVTMQLDDKKLKLSAPLFSDYVFSYNYMDKKTGYIVEEMTQENIEVIDLILKLLADIKGKKEVKGKIKEACFEAYKGLEFKSVEAKTFEIDGKPCKCEGYQTIVTASHLKGLINNISNILFEYYCKRLGIEKGYPKDTFAPLKEEEEEIKDTQFTFFIYENKLAAVEIADDQEVVEIAFKGGATRGQNMCMTTNGQKVLEIIGKTEGEVETLRMIETDEGYVELAYHFKTGELIIGTEDEEEIIKFKITSDDQSLKVGLIAYTVGGEAINGSLTITNKASSDALDGKEFDIGNASEKELEQVIAEIALKLNELD